MSRPEADPLGDGPNAADRPGTSHPLLAEAAFHHLGVVVPDLDAAAATYRALGFREVDRFAVPAQGIEAVLYRLGPSHGPDADHAGAQYLELITPTDPDGAMGRFMAKRGPGMHHAAYRVADVDATLAALAAAGVELIDPVARPGAHGWRVAFLHPRACAGVLTELVQVDDD